MSYEEKVVLSNRVKAKLGGILTVTQTDQVMEILSDCLICFNVEQKDVGKDPPDELIDVFLNTLATQGRSPKTLIRYRYIIRKMLSVVQVPVQDITVYHLRNYLAREKARGISSSTLESTRQVFSSFFNWLSREGILKQNPVANLSPIKRPKKVKMIYSDVEIERMRQQCTNARDRAIVDFLLATGCRIGEVTELNIEDVDLVRLQCTVLGKGNKERVVYLDAVAAMTLEDYLKTRNDANPALFVELRTPHSRIHAGGIRLMLKIIGKKAGVEKVHPHKFRRTQATRLIKHGMPIQEVAAILGHEKIDTTMEYVVLDNNDIKNSYHKYAS